MEINNSMYEVWIVGYNRDGYATDFDFCVASFNHEALAIQEAKHYANAEYIKNLIDTLCIPTPDDLDSVEVRAEEVEEVDQDYFECVDTVFVSETFKI